MVQLCEHCLQKPIIIFFQCRENANLSYKKSEDFVGKNISMKSHFYSFSFFRSSRSSSGSDSSGTSSDSSESSYSSSSSETRRKKGSPQPRKDSKAIDALKLSGAKQQIKLTLKQQTTAPVKKIDRSAMIAGKKRTHESSPPVDNKATTVAAVAANKAAKKANSRREELLKQLKAVEDAIARKRSKV